MRGHFGPFGEHFLRCTVLASDPAEQRWMALGLEVDDLPYRHSPPET